MKISDIKTDPVLFKIGFDAAEYFERLALAAAEVGRVVREMFEPFRRLTRSTPEFEREYLASASWGERFKYHAMRLGGTSQWRAFDILDEERQ